MIVDVPIGVQEGVAVTIGKVGPLLINLWDATSLLGEAVWINV